MKPIDNGTIIVFKVVAPDEKIYIVWGEISAYDELSGVYTITDQNGKLHQRAINKIWYDLPIAQKTSDSGTFNLISKNNFN
jgi:hypothetical protein